MYGYIYKTTNKINNKIYIGQHKRVKFDESYFGSGRLLKKTIKKYGKENFKCEIIEWCENQNQLDEREKYWIEFYSSTNIQKGYNITQGGQSRFFTGLKHSEKSKQKMSEKAKLREHLATTKGRKWINNGSKQKVVKEIDLEKYLNNGWVIGRITHIIPWNKGLTKETDKRVLQYSNSLKKYFENGGTIGEIGLKGNKNGFKKGNIPWNKKH